MVISRGVGEANVAAPDRLGPRLTSVRVLGEADQ